MRPLDEQYTRTPFSCRFSNHHSARQEVEVAERLSTAGGQDVGDQVLDVGGRIIDAYGGERRDTQGSQRDIAAADNCHTLRYGDIQICQGRKDGKSSLIVDGAYSYRRGVLGEQGSQDTTESRTALRNHGDNWGLYPIRGARLTDCFQMCFSQRGLTRGSNSKVSISLVKQIGCLEPRADLPLPGRRGDGRHDRDPKAVQKRFACPVGFLDQRDHHGWHKIGRRVGLLRVRTDPNLPQRRVGTNSYSTKCEARYACNALRACLMCS